MTYMVKVLTFGLTKEFIKDNGRKIKCMEKDRSFGKMEGNILE